MPVNNPRMRFAFGVHRQKICIARDKDSVLGESEWQNRLEVICTKKLGIANRQHVKSAMSQRGSNRMVDVLID